MDVTIRNLKLNFGEATILDNVSAVAKKGEILAVMGPSGSGKSTLLNAIAGRTKATDGEIWIGNQLLNKQLKRKVAYVLQEDVFFPNLTLKETLTFYALLKLPEKMAKEIKTQRVSEIIEILDLTKCADTVIGDARIHGLSGGQKKRASIAIDLLTNPVVLLLDEPTSGLDSSISYHLMTTMAKYADVMTKTVILTIHQPSSRIFHMFHNLLLMIDGKVAYFGDGNKVIDFFADLGLHCLPHYNPADFILDKISDDPEITKTIINEAQKRRQSISGWLGDTKKRNSIDSVNYEVKNEKESENTSRRKSIESRSGSVVQLFPTSRDALQSRSGSTAEIIPEEPKRLGSRSASIVETDVYLDFFLTADSKWMTGFFLQFYTLLRRALKQSSDRIFAIIPIVDLVLHVLVIGVSWFLLQQEEGNIRDKMGVISFVLIRWGYMNIYDGLFAFTLQQDVVDRERSAGIYRLSAFYCSAMAVEIILLSIKAFFYYIVLYWIIGQAVNAAAFFLGLLSFLLSILTAQSVGMLIGVIFVDVRISFVIGTSVASASAIYGGFFRTNFPIWLHWISYLSYVYYGFNALMKIEFNYGKPFSCAPANATVFSECLFSPNENGVQPIITGESILEKYKLTNPIWVDISAMIFLIVFCRVVGYIVLRYRGPKKQEIIKKKKQDSKKWKLSIKNIKDKF